MAVSCMLLQNRSYILGTLKVERSGNNYLCGCGCALLNEPCLCWHSYSSCTCTSHLKSSQGRPLAHLSHPPLIGSPPRKEGPDHSAHSLGPLKTHKANNFTINLLHF